MYILLEMSDSRGDASKIYNYDAMGYVVTEEAALLWVGGDPNFRAYKYCPNKELIPV